VIDVKKCCVCKKIIWPGQQSNISFNPIHKKCHKTLITKSMKDNPEMSGMYLKEMDDFSRKTKQPVF
jgi:hypothetical protein